MKGRAVRILLVIAVVVLGTGAAIWGINRGQPGSPGVTTLTISEAARTLLYVPVYHAKEKGYFQELGLDVRIVTGGTATNAVAAMLSGEAEFALADPMYVPISREKGARSKVVAQVVGRVAIWGVARDPSLRPVSKDNLTGKRIATHPRPMSAYTYTRAVLRRLGLDPENDVTILPSQPGTELGPLFNGEADLVFTVEPNVSKAVGQGAQVVFSCPEAFGDQLLSGLLTREDFISSHHREVEAVAVGVQRALQDIRRDPESAVQTAKGYFPQLDDVTIRTAILRLINEGVIPTTVVVSEDSWTNAIAVRVESGDLAQGSGRQVNCALDIMEAAASK